MKLTLLACLVLAVACTNSGHYSKAENALDAGRQFVDGFLNGDHDKAFFYLLKDSTNEMLFETQRSAYRSMDAATQKNYQGASIYPTVTDVNDSTTLFRYYHSAKPTDTTTLRIVRKNGEWLVDLKSVIKM